MEFHGITMVIDSGLPTSLFTNIVASHGEHFDLVKFGWETALVTHDVDRRTAVLREAGIDYCVAVLDAFDPGRPLFEAPTSTSATSHPPM